MSEMIFNDHTRVCPSCHMTIRYQTPRLLTADSAEDGMVRLMEWGGHTVIKEPAAKDQRIRDLEREVAEWRERAETQQAYHDKRVSDIEAQNVRIAELEREVGRANEDNDELRTEIMGLQSEVERQEHFNAQTMTKYQNALSETVALRSEVERVDCLRQMALTEREADRADAERFRWAVKQRVTWEYFTEADVRAGIDAAMAKETKV